MRWTAKPRRPAARKRHAACQAAAASLVPLWPALYKELVWWRGGRNAGAQSEAGIGLGCWHCLV